MCLILKFQNSTKAINITRTIQQSKCHKTNATKNNATKTTKQKLKNCTLR